MVRERYGSPVAGTSFACRDPRRREHALSEPFPERLAIAPGALDLQMTRGDLRHARAGFRDIEVRRVESPVRTPTAAECVRFERESFGALHQMMASLSTAEREETWKEIEETLAKFEGAGGFTGPCEMLVGAGTK